MPPEDLPFYPINYTRVICSRLLNLALDESVVRTQDAYKVFISVGQNPVGRSLAWDFFRAKWDDIFEKYAWRCCFSFILGFE